jgi:hypothetical protein
MTGSSYEFENYDSNGEVPGGAPAVATQARKPIAGGGRPKIYKAADGKRIVGVTTVVNRFKDSGGLIHWAWKEGSEGRDYREKRDLAAEAGGICHQWIDDHIHGRERTPFPAAQPEQLQQAEKGFEAFIDWAAQCRLEVLETETPIVSEQYRFAGTFDALALVAGKLVLFDWKTSNGVYSDYIAQVAAYRQLLRERDGIDKAPRAAQLLRFGKEFADFHAHSYPEAVLDMGWEFFQRALVMHELDAKMKKVAA